MRSSDSRYLQHSTRGTLRVGPQFPCRADLGPRSQGLPRGDLTSRHAESVSQAYMARSRSRHGTESLHGPAAGPSHRPCGPRPLAADLGYPPDRVISVTLQTAVLVPLVMAVMRAERPMLRLPAGLGQGLPAVPAASSRAGGGPVVDKLHACHADSRPGRWRARSASGAPPGALAGAGRRLAAGLVSPRRPARSGIRPRGCRR